MYVLAIDIGASSGRHILGSLQNGRLVYEEVYRFPNGAHMKDGLLCWDHDALWEHILNGMRKCRELGKIPVSVGVDTWGVDIVLLDKNGQLCAPTVAYRDSSTESFLDRIGFDSLYRRTGIARQPFNTVYRLMSMPAAWLEKADRCLFVPDYFHYLLSGIAANEYTESSTGALLNAESRTWDESVLREAGIPSRLFPEAPREPGTKLGRLRPEVCEKVGFDCDVILPASHDTGSAYLSVPARNDRAVYLSSGTWSLLGIETRTPLTTESAMRSGFTNEGGYGGSIRLLRNIMGLWMLQCIRHEMHDAYSFAQMAAMADEADYDGIVDVNDNRFLAPADMTEEVKAALREQGRPLPETPGQLFRCVTRSLAVCYAQAIRDLSALTGRTFDTIHIVGGGCQNEVLNRWTHEESGLTVVAGPTEATALGNICAQMIALGTFRDLDDARRHIREDFEVKVYD